MLDIISNNPFRVLGVYSNTRPVEIVRNVGRIKAFTSVGKEVSFPTDLMAYLGPICRDGDAIQTAQSRISTKEDRVRCALFWFMNVSQVDEKGLIIAREGKFDDAFMFWQDEGNLINRAVVSLLVGDYKRAIVDYMDLFHWNKHREDFLSILIDDPSSFTSNDLSRLLFEELLKTAKPKELLDILHDIGDFPCVKSSLLSYAKSHGKMKVGTFKYESGEIKKRCIFENTDGSVTYVDFSPTLGELTPTEIASQKDCLFVVENPYGPELCEWDYNCAFEIDIIKDTASKQPAGRVLSTISAFTKAWQNDNNHALDALYGLISDTHRDLKTVKELVGENDPRYSSIAERVSKAIVQSIPQYFSESDLPELDKCSSAIAFLDFAETISSIGTIKEVTDKHRKEIESIKASYLPSLPAIVSADEDSIRSMLFDFYKESVEVVDYSIVSVDKNGNYVSELVYDKPQVHLKKTESATIDSLLHQCAPVLFSIKQKLEPELESYVQFSTQIVRSLYNGLVHEINTALKSEEKKYNRYLSLRSKYANSSDYIQAKHIMNPLMVSYHYPEIDELLIYEKEYGDELSPYDLLSFRSFSNSQTLKTTKRFKEKLGVVLSDLNNLSRYDMEKGFRSGVFEPNHSSLRTLFISIGGMSVTTIKDADIDMMTEREKEEERLSKTFWGRFKKNFISK